MDNQRSFANWNIALQKEFVFINKLGGKVKNILKNPPMNNTNIPICKRPLIIHLTPFFLIFI